VARPCGRSANKTVMMSPHDRDAGSSQFACTGGSVKARPEILDSWPRVLRAARRPFRKARPGCTIQNALHLQVREPAPLLR